MRNKLFFALIVFCLLTLGFADNIVPLNVKEGLWEVTVTHSMTGMPPMPNLSPDMLAKMPPEQRARIEALTSGKPSTDIRKECVTKEKLEKHSAFTNNRDTCTNTVVNSTGRKLEVKFHCEEKQSIADGNFVMETIGTDNAKGTMHMATNSNSGHNMTMDFTITSKYLGAECGAIK